jgi:hypothetical protein
MSKRTSAELGSNVSGSDARASRCARRAQIASEKELAAREQQLAPVTPAANECAVGKQAVVDEMTAACKAGEAYIHITAKMSGAADRTMITKSRRTLKKLMQKYCQVKNLDFSGTSFFLEDEGTDAGGAPALRKLESEDTGDAVGLKQGSVLQVFPPQAVAEK